MLSYLWMVLVLLFGITGPQPPVVVEPPSPSPSVVTPSGTEITMASGRRELILLGTGNPSIGDGYSISDEGDPATVRASVTSENTTPGCAPGGCTYKYYLVLQASAPGTTTVTTQYCFRSAPPKCEDKGVAPVKWTVQVTEQ